MTEQSKREDLELPSCDDRLLWDVWMSVYHFPALVVADELGLFALLDRAPATIEEIAAALSLNPRAVEAMVSIVASLGFLENHQGKFYLTTVSRNFLLPESRYYWGGVLEINRSSPAVCGVRDAMQKGSFAAFPKSIWELQELHPERARAFTRVMHSHGFAAALGVARYGGFSGTERLLDIGGGSGCYSIALALRHAAMEFTLIELPAVCEVAKEYIREYQLEDRIKVMPLDIFHEPWPGGYNAIFFSDIFHNWSVESCRYLAARSLESLSPGGHIYLHEVLLADGKDRPLVAASYAMQMLAHTEGKQFTAKELVELLEGVGFRDVTIVAGYSYYSLVSACKP